MMKALLNVNDLRDAVGRMVSIVDRKTTRPILSLCVLDFSKDYLTLTATDLEVAAKIRINAKVDVAEKFCINPKSLYDILRELPDAELTLSTKEGEGLLKLSLGQIKFSLLINSTEEYPVLTFAINKTPFGVKCGDLKKIIDRTSYAISNDETRIFLNGIFFQSTVNSLKAVATDGYRLALIEIPGIQTTDSRLSEGFILPKKGVAELRKTVDTLSHNDQLEMQLDENFLYVKTSQDNLFAIRLISRDFPKYQANIPTKTSYKMDVNRENLITAIKRVKVLANEKTNGVKMSLRPGQIQISSNHPTLGEASEIIPAVYDGKNLDIGFSAKYLLDSFASIDSQQLSLEFNNELSPVILKSKEMPEYFGVIMPLRLQN